MSKRNALFGPEIFDGDAVHVDCALLVDGPLIKGLCSIDDIPTGYTKQELDDGQLLPGYIDLQVNGGGGVLFNEELSVEGIEAICAAHNVFGTTSVLVTLITDTPEVTARAIKAGIEAVEKGVPGFLGLHLEGPHLFTAKKGAHDAELIRPMEEKDLEILLEAKSQLPNLMVTIAIESVTSDQIRTLSKAGIVVSLGHTAATFEQAQIAENAGARCVTHLFNAMSPLTHREPGLVGATLKSDTLFAGLIADGIHVVPAAVSIALTAKSGYGKIFLVSDAMSTVGTDASSFELNGRTVCRRDGKLTFYDGTLAGADLTLHQAVRFIEENTELGFHEAHRMASLYPAQCVARSANLGYLKPDYEANIIHQSRTGEISQTWIAGIPFRPD